MMMSSTVSLVNLASRIVMIVVAAVDTVESVDVVFYWINRFERFSNLSDWSTNWSTDWSTDWSRCQDLIEILWKLVEFSILLSINSDDEGIIFTSCSTLSSVRSVGWLRWFILRRRLLWRQIIVCGLLRFVRGESVRLLLGAPLQSDGLLHRVRIDKFEDTNLLGNDLADLPGGQVWN